MDSIRIEFHSGKYITIKDPIRILNGTEVLFEKKPDLTWKDGQGKVWDLQDMSVEHIVNCIKHICERWKGRYERAFNHFGECFGPSFHIEPPKGYSTFDILKNMLLEEQPYLEHFRDELERRKNSYLCCSVVAEINATVSLLATQINRKQYANND